MRVELMEHFHYIAVIGSNEDNTIRVARESLNVINSNTKKGVNKNTIQQQFV